MVIQFVGKQKSSVHWTSLPTGHAGDLIEVEYWVTDKESKNHFNFPIIVRRSFTASRNFNLVSSHMKFFMDLKFYYNSYSKIET